MRTGFWTAIIAAVAICVGVATPSAGAPPPPPLSAYGALPAMSQVTLSDDGSRLAFVGVSGENRKLILQTVEGQVLAAMDLGKVTITDLIWAGNDDIVIVTSQTRSLPEIGWPKTKFWTAQSFSLTKKRVINLSGRVSDSYGMIFSDPVVRRVDGKYFAFFSVISNVGTPRLLLAKVSIADGSATTPEFMVVREGLGWLIDETGVAGARSRYDDERGGWGAAIRRGVAGWPEVMRVSAKLDRPWLTSFAQTGSNIVVGVNGKVGDEYIEIGLDGVSKPALPTDRAYDSVLVDERSSRLIGAVWRDDTEHLMLFDPVAKAQWDKVQRTFKDQRIALLSWTTDWQKIAVYVEGAQNSGMYYLVDLANKRADIIGDRYPQVTPEQVAEVRPYSYKAADGLEIRGYLTLPPGRDPKSLPLVVLPHGGPQARDELTFDWWAQALASRGYAVLQPNFRGSTGYGTAFVEAGYGEWGRKMQTDLSDGVQALAKDGLIDPKRVCIAGASYGGYAAMAGVTIENGVYRCSVAVAGVSDLGRMLETEADSAGEKSSATRYWKRFMGATGANDPALVALSPARLASRADAPILLIHGKDDTVVPYEQSVLLADALRKAGKPVELVTLAGEDHNLSGSATRQQMLEALVAFVLKHNPPT